jgi:hypothetical protein
LTAAIVLARGGVSVEAHERRDRLGHRFIGDLHGIENWSSDEDVTHEFERWGVRRNFLCEPATEVCMTNGTRVARLAGDRPVFYVVSRGSVPGSVESGLAEQAQHHGVQLHLSSPLRAEDADVVATGPDPRHRFCVETGIRFRTSAGRLAVGLVHPEAAHRGYAYLLIHDGWGCLCVVMFGEFSRAREQLALARALLSARFQFDIREPEALGGYGSFLLSPDFGTATRPRVGEVTGVQDFVWGFGIRRAMEAGALAARCFLEGRDYPALGRARFEPHQRVGVVNRLLWEATAFQGFPFYLWALGRAPHPLGPLSRAHHADLPHHLLFPLARRVFAARHAGLLGV